MTQIYKKELKDLYLQIVDQTHPELQKSLLFTVQSFSQNKLFKRTNLRLPFSAHFVQFLSIPHSYLVSFSLFICKLIRNFPLFFCLLHTIPFIYKACQINSSN